MKSQRGPRWSLLNRLQWAWTYFSVAVAEVMAAAAAER